MSFYFLFVYYFFFMNPIQISRVKGGLSSKIQNSFRLKFITTSWLHISIDENKSMNEENCVQIWKFGLFSVWDRLFEIVNAITKMVEPWSWYDSICKDSLLHCPILSSIFCILTIVFVWPQLSIEVKILIRFRLRLSMCYMIL